MFSISLGKSVWDSLLENDLISHSVDNIFTYFGDNSTLNPILVDFVNRSSENLNFSTAEEIFGEEAARRFFDAAIRCNEVNNEKYQKILNSLGYSYDTFNINDISGEKFKIIVENQVVQMNKESLPFIRSHYSDNVLNYISKNRQEYLEIMTTELFDFDEANKILSWKVNDVDKIKILSFTNKAVSVIGKGYSDAVTSHILSNNLDANDLPQLFSTYENWGQSTKKEILRLAEQYIINGSPISGHISNALLSLLFTSDSIGRDRKLNLFVSSLIDMDETNCKEHLNEIVLSELKKIFVNGRPKVTKDTENEKLLAAFKDKDWIYDYQEDEASEKFTIIKRKP